MANHKLLFNLLGSINYQPLFGKGACSSRELTAGLVDPSIVNFDQ